MFVLHPLINGPPSHATARTNSRAHSLSSLPPPHFPPPPTHQVLRIFDTFETTTRTQLMTFRGELEQQLQGLRESNAAFRASFRTFSENGNFSLEEINTFKQVVNHLLQRISQLEDEISTELEQIETSCIERAQAAVARFESTYVIHHRDLALLEAQENCMSSCRVRRRGCL